MIDLSKIIIIQFQTLENLGNKFLQQIYQSEGLSNQTVNLKI
ncbi:hypothetical protein pb186bvf_006658 [Paramecium bursaria]